MAIDVAEEPRFQNRDSTHETGPYKTEPGARGPMRSTLTFRRYLVLVTIMFTGSLGDIFLSAGMKQAGPVTLHHWTSLFTALAIPWVAGGIVLLSVFFATYLTALSWADLTFVLPATSFSYVVIALLSKFWLQETITAGRWFGIVLIMAGVGFVTRGPAYTHTDATSPEGEIPEGVALKGKAPKERSA